ncbi:MAG: hypothetical protein IJE05_02055 [Clostridia bacterium]|nr:hypothetical protein [Clostridia bacterium]
MDIQMHLYTISEVKRFIREKDYEGLKKYIEEREKQVRAYQEEDKSGDYIEDLVSKLT